MDAELLRANLVRTLVPLIVGALASVPLLSGTAKFAPMIGFAVSAAYYAVFRVAETKYPALGVFLGKRAKKDTRFTSGSKVHHEKAHAGPKKAARSPRRRATRSASRSTASTSSGSSRSPGRRVPTAPRC